MPHVEITIPVVSTWPSRVELSARNRVEDALNSTKIGKSVGAGGGMGQMDLSYLVDESILPKFRQAVDEAMKTHMPDFRYQIKVSEDKG